jgi:predicted type IV restriction endonuclease
MNDQAVVEQHMKEQLVALLSKIRTNQNLMSLGESQAKSGIIEPILRILGWDTSLVSDEVILEYTVEGGRVDYCLRINTTPKVFIEAKKPAEDLERHQAQLLQYSFRHGVPLAVLCNGISWAFYLPLVEGEWENRRFYTINILDQDTIEAASRFIDFLSRHKVESDDAANNARQLLEVRRKLQIIKDTVPQAWNKIISEPDTFLLNHLIEVTHKLCGVKPEVEQVAGFLKQFGDRFQLLPQDEVADEPEPVRPPATRIPNQVVNEPASKISQSDIIPHILKSILRHGDRALKKTVEDDVYSEFKNLFDQPWYQELTTTANVPRWQHNVAWARNLAKDRGLIKPPEESGRGYWELTELGKRSAQNSR